MGFIMSETCDIIRYLLSDIDHFDERLPLDLEAFDDDLKIEILEMAIKYLKSDKRRKICKEVLNNVCRRNINR